MNNREVPTQNIHVELPAQVTYLVDTIVSQGWLDIPDANGSYPNLKPSKKSVIGYLLWKAGMEVVEDKDNPVLIEMMRVGFEDLHHPYKWRELFNEPQVEAAANVADASSKIAALGAKPSES